MVPARSVFAAAASPERTRLVCIAGCAPELVVEMGNDRRGGAIPGQLAQGVEQHHGIQAA